MTTTINASTSSGLVNTADTSGILQLQTAGTAAVTIDTSQNVGIGTTSPNSYGAGYTATTINNTTGAVFDLNIAGTRQGTIFALNDGSVTVGNITNNPLAFRTNNTERMRIDSSGNVLVGTTSAGPIFGSEKLVVGGSATIKTTGNSGLGIWTNSGSSGVSTMCLFYNGSAPTAIGSITGNGSNAAYNTSSDYRLKENIAPMTGALDKVALLKPVTYTWKSDNSAGQGFIAHELQAVVPDCVTGEKDAVDAEGKPVYQGIDTSFLVATLTAAIQEQQALIVSQSELINSLTARVTALEAK